MVMAAVSQAITTFTSLKASPYHKSCHPSLFRASFFRPQPIYQPKPRLKICHKPLSFTVRQHRLATTVSCLSSEGSDENLESNYSSEEASVNLNLPRRRLLVQFTCNACGERTKRFINRVAYERGTVFVQCAGCLQHHKLVDNLGLVVEYDFREDIS